MINVTDRTYTITSVSPLLSLEEAGSVFKHTNVYVGLAALIDGVGSGEVEDRGSALALEGDERVGGLAQGDASGPQERRQRPERGRHL